MSRRTRRAGRASIEDVRMRIEEWRRTRAKRCKMPELLWAAAVGVAREHGIYAASRELRVNYTSLRSRVEARGGKEQPSKSTAGASFVELAPGLPWVSGRGGMIVELTASDGSKLALQLAPDDKVDVLGLAREFWRRGV